MQFDLLKLETRNGKNDRDINAILLNIKINWTKWVNMCEYKLQQTGKISRKYTYPEWKYYKKF